MIREITKDMELHLTHELSTLRNQLPEKRSVQYWLEKNPDLMLVKINYH
jgi:hypothetical protein